MFLTNEELIELTGYKKAAYMPRWLKKNGYRFEIGADGWPKVLRTSVITKLGGSMAHREPRLNFG